MWEGSVRSGHWNPATGACACSTFPPLLAHIVLCIHTSSPPTRQTQSHSHPHAPFFSSRTRAPRTDDLFPNINKHPGHRLGGLLLQQRHRGNAACERVDGDGRDHRAGKSCVPTAKRWTITYNATRRQRGRHRMRRGKVLGAMAGPVPVLPSLPLPSLIPATRSPILTTTTPKTIHAHTTHLHTRLYTHAFFTARLPHRGDRLFPHSRHRPHRPQPLPRLRRLCVRVQRHDRVRPFLRVRPPAHVHDR